MAQNGWISPKMAKITEMSTKNVYQNSHKSHEKRGQHDSSVPNSGIALNSGSGWYLPKEKRKKRLNMTKN